MYSNGFTSKNIKIESNFENNGFDFNGCLYKIVPPSNYLV